MYCIAVLRCSSSRDARAQAEKCNSHNRAVRDFRECIRKACDDGRHSEETATVLRVRYIRAILLVDVAKNRHRKRRRTNEEYYLSYLARGSAPAVYTCM